MKQRVAFFVSDRTGLTTQAVGESLLTQFEGLEVKRAFLPYVDTIKKAKEVTKLINDAGKMSGVRPLVFCTLMDDQVREVIKESDAFVLDYFDQFIGPLEEELGMLSSHVVGRAHAVKSDQLERVRTDAVNYALLHDDGQITDFREADIILTGISRSGKTPISLYFALKFGLFVGNYPLTEDDFHSKSVPESLKRFQHRLFGLSVIPNRLHTMRQVRLPNSKYSSRDQCQYEYNWALEFFEQNEIPYIDNGKASIEEVAAKIMQRMELEPRFH